jgi:hypothetical protein
MGVAPAVLRPDIGHFAIEVAGAGFGRGDVQQNATSGANDLWFSVEERWVIA